MRIPCPWLLCSPFHFRSHPSRSYLSRPETTKRASTNSKMKSWIEIPSDSDFSLDNIPFGICSFPSSTSPPPTTLAPPTPRCCTAIGNYAIDLHLLAEAGLLDDLAVVTTKGVDETDIIITNFHPRIVFSKSTLNDFMSCEKQIWVAVRNRLISLFLDSSSSIKNINNCSNDGGIIIQADNRLQQNPTRSEERRVGKECRSRWSPYH